MNWMNNDMVNIIQKQKRCLVAGSFLFNHSREKIEIQSNLKQIMSPRFAYSKTLIYKVASLTKMNIDHLLSSIPTPIPTPIATPTPKPITISNSLIVNDYSQILNTILIILLTILCYKYLILSNEVEYITKKMYAIQQELDELNEVDNNIEQNVRDVEQKLNIKLQTQSARIQDNLNIEMCKKLTEIANSLINT
jgi:hypothetical protein